MLLWWDKRCRPDRHRQLSPRQRFTTVPKIEFCSTAPVSADRYIDGRSGLGGLDEGRGQKVSDMTERFEMEWDGRRYFLSPRGFYDARTFLKPPEVIHQHLKAACLRKLQVVLQTERNVPLLLKYSRLAKDFGHLDLAEKITERALSAEPKNCFAIARLSSILRSKGQPRQALAATCRIPEGSQTHPVLTSRAAALCDLDRWQEADEIIRRALGRLRGRPKVEATEAFSVLQRIRRSQGL
jgi:tetratricopeptide (TPR) repeat protein